MAHASPPELGHLVVAVIAGPLVLAIVVGAPCAVARGPWILGACNLGVAVALAGVELVGLVRGTASDPVARGLRELAAGWLVLSGVFGALWVGWDCAQAGA